MTDDEAKDAILAAAWLLPRPVTPTAIEEAAAKIIDGQRLFEFRKWLEKSGAALCARLNA